MIKLEWGHAQAMKNSDDLRAMYETGGPLTHEERHQLAREARHYRWADQLSLKEVEALVERLNKIIERIRREAGAQGEKS
jgi:hypothetical protein